MGSANRVLFVSIHTFSWSKIEDGTNHIAASWKNSCANRIFFIIIINISLLLLESVSGAIAFPFHAIQMNTHTPNNQPNSQHRTNLKSECDVWNRTSKKIGEIVATIKICRIKKSICNVLTNAVVRMTKDRIFKSSTLHCIR